jgi:hypothetical protein
MAAEAYSVTTYCWQVVDHWQTLIAGILAVIAAVGAITATMIAANREIAAAQQQTKAARDQIAAEDLREERRSASDALNFFQALDAVIGIVEADVDAARKLIPENLDKTSYSRPAYIARKRIKMTAFKDISGAILRNDSAQSTQFLSLYNKIEEYASQTYEELGVSASSVLKGRNENILNELQEIEDICEGISNKNASSIDYWQQQLKALGGPDPGKGGLNK